ncbi:hypothetical protein Q4534_17540 [Cyclobacterium sp. 1_MG-2023]|uniref:hypothetical protein n=1 Tax=Cyclobacterium sp. 1_MG-2023 TaxID=3062681 RepID=UPI0026E3824E|nr:hypothetical protein [Cyclobacterium sp. 1_MG-2023]MDO6439230.1 hypothetical protein [Cyclobacterium sp. 1_MG-2023]
MVRLCVLLAMTFWLNVRLQANDLYLGAASADISPKLPVALMGQFHMRIAETADTPLYAGIVAIESRDGQTGLDTAVFVSCDLVYISARLRQELRDEVAKRIPGFNVNKIIVSATHTHTAPVLEDDLEESSFIYPIPEEGVTKVKDYRALFVESVADGIEDAWANRSKGSVTWGMDRAAVGYNRRTVYKDGTSVMYGNTNKEEFQNLEGYEDHDMNALFFWNDENELLAMSVDVACPAQEFEHKTTVNADYWHPVREKLKSRFGEKVSVLGWIGAAGDQSPHSMYRKAGLARMQELAQKTRMDDIAERIIRAVENTYEIVKNDRHTNVAFHHKMENLELPMRIITEEEYIASEKVVKDCQDQIAADPSKAPLLYAKMTWFGDVLKRYEAQQKNPEATYTSEIHVLRIGDAAIATNQFELFTDYGIRIQARSKAIQTFVIQLAGPGTYLPTEKAIAGGGYSAVCQSNVVGAEGGQLLVDRTLEIIDKFWDKENEVSLKKKL